MKPYRLHLVQFLKPMDHVERINFCINMQEAIVEDGFLDRLVFSDESTFHLSGKVYRHNVRIWSTENPHAMVQHERASPKSNVFLRNAHTKGLWAFVFP
jgi:hypothetical protein